MFETKAIPRTAPGRTTFTYVAPSWTNVITYVVALGALILAASHWGTAVWSALVDFAGPRGAFIGGGFLLYMGWFWLVGGLYIALDHFKRPDLLYRHKIQQRALNARRKGPPLFKAVALVLFNQFLGTLPGLFIVYAVLQWRGVDLSGPAPGALTMAGDLVGFVLVEELLFYTFHRALHWQPLFRRFHRVHHEFHESIGIATHYVHPVEHWVGNLTPIFAGPILLGSHPVTMMLWVLLAVTNAIVTHSGYSLPWLAWSIEHDFHHWNIRGSYGAVGLLDNVLGTGKALNGLAKPPSS
jgi:fatty acid hydroxylase domain-containing protein 2